MNSLRIFTLVMTLFTYAFSTTSFARPFGEVVKVMLKFVPDTEAPFKEELNHYLTEYLKDCSRFPLEQEYSWSIRRWQEVRFLLERTFPKDLNVNLNDWQQKVLDIFVAKVDYRDFQKSDSTN